MIKKETQYTNPLLCFLIHIISHLDVFGLRFHIFCWFLTDFHFNSLSLTLVFLCFSEWSLFLLHNENVIFAIMFEEKASIFHFCLETSFEDEQNVKPA